MFQIFASGSILSLKSRFLLISTYFSTFWVPYLKILVEANHYEQKNVVYNWDIKIMKNASVQIFVSGAILALKSRFLFLLSYFQHILGQFSTSKFCLKLITMNRKSVVNNLDIKFLRKNTYFNFQFIYRKISSISPLDYKPPRI